MVAARALRSAAAVALVGASAFFLARQVLAHWEQVRGASWHLAPLPLLASVLLHVGVLAGGTWLWSRVVARFDASPVAPGHLLRVWSLSSLARYVPGNVWQFVAAGQLAAAQGLSRRLLFPSLAVHLGITLLAAAAVGASASAWARPDVVPPWTAWLTVPSALLLAHPRIIDGAVRLLARSTRCAYPRWRGTWGDGVRLLALGVTSWLVYGLAFWLFVRSVSACPASALASMVGANALSFLAGYVVLVAPAGLGVREAALALLLEGTLADGAAALVAILARLWSIAAELGLAGVALLWRPGALSAAPRGDRGAPPAPAGGEARPAPPAAGRPLR